MNLKIIYEMGPWDWPAETGSLIHQVLADRVAEPADRLLAAEMAGDTMVINDQLAEALLALVDNDEEGEELREQAAVSLGPALEHAYIYEFDDPDDLLLSEAGFQMVQTSLQKIYQQAGVPENVRRRILEAAVRAPRDWHSAAVRAALASKDPEWRLTAVFCMRFIQGFDQEILEALKSADSEIRYQAIHAAGNWGLKAAWPQIGELLSLKNRDRSLLLAAIEATAGIGIPEAAELLENLLESEDDEILDSVHEALAMLGEGLLEDYEGDEDDQW